MSRKDDRLIPCPFCGGEPELTNEDNWGYNHDAWVTCTKCGVETRHYDAAKNDWHAVNAWNRRVPKTTTFDPLCYDEADQGEPNIPCAEEYYGGWYICKACGAHAPAVNSQSPLEPYENLGPGITHGPPNYCYNCGAKRKTEVPKRKGANK